VPKTQLEEKFSQKNFFPKEFLERITGGWRNNGIILDLMED
jgi:hypothetical protein